METTGAGRRIALVEDDADLRVSTAQVLSLAGFSVESFASGAAALETVDANWDGLVISDVRMPHMSGTELFRILYERDPDLPVILVTGHGDVTMAVDALKAGAWDFLTKPFDPATLVAAADRAAMARSLALENRRLRAVAESNASAGLIGQSPAIRRLREMIPVLADADMDMFIEGETGTGKELLARLIHRAGKRARQRFMSVSCGALPPVLEEELFAAAGAGSIASVSRGTLFLDDLDQASRNLQARLTPLVEERAMRSPGAREPLPLDFRVIATGGAEAGDLSTKVTPGLFYRIAALRVQIPALRERREDVPALFAHLASAAATRLRLPLPMMSGAVRHYLESHEWPGNVRELSHFAERFVLGLETPVERQPQPGAGETLPERLDAFEREIIIAAVQEAEGQIGAAIDALGIPRKTFYYKVRKHGIDLVALRGKPG